MYNADPCLCYTRVACIPRLVLYGHILPFRHTTTAEIIHYPHRYILNTELAYQLDSDCCSVVFYFWVHVSCLLNAT
jgi:hypothetical protein